MRHRSAPSVRRASACVLCVALALSSLSLPSPHTASALFTPTQAQAAGEYQVKVRYHTSANVGNIWLQPTFSTPPAHLTCGSATVGQGADLTLSETVSASDLKGCTAQLSSGDLSAYKAAHSSNAEVFQAISTNPNDYYFAGWYTTLYSATARPRMVSAAEALTRDQILTITDETQQDVYDFYALYLPKGQTSSVSFPTGESFSFDPYTRKLLNVTAADGDVLATCAAPDFMHIDKLLFGVAPSNPGFEISSFAGPAVTKRQLEAFLVELGGPGAAHLYGTGTITVTPQLSYNELKLSFHANTSSSAYVAQQTLSATQATNETNSLTGLNTLASLQSAAASSAAFSAPASGGVAKTFDGWLVSSTPVGSLPATSAAASAQGYDTVSDATAKAFLNAYYKVRASTELHFYPLWVDADLGWREDDDGVRYYNSVLGTPTPLVGKHAIAGSTYLFDSDGLMLTGWQGTAGERRYYDPAEGESPTGGGAMVHDALRTLAGKTHYFKHDGSLATDEAVEAGGKTFYFGSDGDKAVGWQGPLNDKRYFDPDDNGAMVTSRLFVLNEGEDEPEIHAYCVKADGRPVKDQLYTVNKLTYLLDENGHALSGWQKAAGLLCYFDPATYAMATSGLTAVEEDVFYFRSDGSHAVSQMVTTDGGNRYYFDAEGKLARNATVQVGEREYTADENGVLHTNYHDYTSDFRLGRDNNSFVLANQKETEGFYGCRDYAVQEGLFNRLTQSASETDRAFLQLFLRKGWAGESYGVASAQALLFNGALKLSDLTASVANSFFALPLPYKEPQQLGVFNYLMASQLVSGYTSRELAYAYYSRYAATYDTYEGTQPSSTLERFLMDVVENPEDDDVRLLCYFVGTTGHTVLVTGVTYREALSEYDVLLYDVNGAKDGGFLHLKVASDFKTFSFTDARGNTVNEKTVKELYFINPSRLEGLVRGGVGRLASQNALEGAGVGELPAGHALITLPLGERFTLENAAGKKLEGDGTTLSGDMPIYQMGLVVAEDASVFQLEVDSSSYEISTESGEIDFSARGREGLVALEASRATSAELDLSTNRVRMEGKDAPFSASLLTHADGGNGLVTISGTVGSALDVSRVGRSGVNVRASDGLSHVEARRHVDAGVKEKSISASSSFSLDVEDDFVLPDTAGTPSSPETPSSAEEPETPDENKNGWHYEEGFWRHYQRGVVQTGWLWCDDAWGRGWYFLDARGNMCTGWVCDGGLWYWMHASGKMATWWVCDGGTWYYCNGSGVMQRGWQWVNGHWYWLGASGAMATGWQEIAAAWYYLHPSGEMASDEWVDGYYLARDGRWLG